MRNQKRRKITAFFADIQIFSYLCIRKVKIFYLKKAFYILFSLILLLQSCQNGADNVTANLSFSVDTLLFDTVFTSMGSSTRIVTVKNENRHEVVIDKVMQASGDCFHINLDGESSLDYMRQIRLSAGDSLFLFVRATIDPLNSNSPVLVNDQVTFHLSNGNSRTLEIEAFGQDVTLIDSLYIDADRTLTADRPYLVRYWLAGSPEAKVTIEPGATFYMHKGAQLIFYGQLVAEGTVEAPIIFMGDRLDDYIAGIPYSHVPGQWSGLYLYDYQGTAPEWRISNVRIISATNGLFCYGRNYANRPTLSLSSARIHNHDQYGLVLQNVNAEVSNSEISNCASYCVYLQGGESRFVHNTIASYYRYTQYNSNVGLYDTQREDVAAVYVNNLSKDRLTSTSFVNCIITGVRDNQFVLASPLPDLYSGVFRGNYIKTDSLNLRNASGNVYAQEKDTVFRNNYYSDHVYYDFRLDSVSPARGIADSLTSILYPVDLLGNKRITPDAGCYVYTVDSTATTEPEN